MKSEKSKSDLNYFFLEVFQKALIDTFNGMTGVFTATVDKTAVKQMVHKFDQEKGQGVASILGFGGGINGRIILWVNSGLAGLITEHIVGEKPSGYKDEMVLFTINELNNIVSGSGTTVINNNHNLSLRLSPPSIFAGDSFEIITPHEKSLVITASVKGNDSYYQKLLTEKDRISLVVTFEGGKGNGC